MIMADRFVVVTGTVSIEASELQLRADAALWRGAGSEPRLFLSGVQLRLSRFSVDAEFVQVDGDELSGQWAALQPCACESRFGVSARRFRLRGDDLLLKGGRLGCSNGLGLPLPPISLGVGRRSGLLPPVFRQTRREGLRVGLPFFWAVTDRVGLTFTPSIATRRGPVGEARIDTAEAAVRWEARLDAADIDGSRPQLGDTARGRGSLEAHVAQTAVPWPFGRLELQTDPSYAVEFGDEWLARQVEFHRSEVGWASMREHIAGSFQVSAQQDLRPQRFGFTASESISGQLRDLGPFPSETNSRLRLATLRAGLRREVRPWLFTSSRAQVDGFGSIGVPDGFVRADVGGAADVRLDGPGGLALLGSVGFRGTGWGGDGADGRFGPRLAAELLWARAREWIEVELRARTVVIPGLLGETPSALMVFDEIDFFERIAQVRTDLELRWLRLPGELRYRTWVGGDLGLDGPGLGPSDWIHRLGWFDRAFFVEAGAAVGLRDGRVVEGWVETWGRLASIPLDGRMWFRWLGRRPSDRAFIPPEGLVPAGTEPLSGFVPLDDFLAASDRSELLPLSRTVQAGLELAWSPWRWLRFDGALALSFIPASSEELYGTTFPAGLQRFRGAVTVFGPCGCWSVRGAVGAARDRGGIESGVSLGWNPKLSSFPDLHRSEIR